MDQEVTEHFARGLSHAKAMLRRFNLGLFVSMGLCATPGLANAPDTENDVRCIHCCGEPTAEPKTMQYAQRACRAVDLDRSDTNKTVPGSAAQEIAFIHVNQSAGADENTKTNQQANEPETIEPSQVSARLFPISASIEADCKRRDEDFICRDVHENLVKFSREFRDPLWADKMEATIKHDVLSEEARGRFRIRHLECRTFTCVSEVESTASNLGVHGSYMGGMQPGHQALKAVLKTNYNTWAYETSPEGERVTVTVITFTRR